MYNVWVITRRLAGSGHPMQIAVDFTDSTSWTDITSQNDVTQFQLTVAEGQLSDLSTFNVLAGASFPGIAVAANANSCLLGFELVDEFYDITSSDMESEIGSVDRANFLTFVDAKWHAKSADLSAVTTDTMTRRAFVDALVTTLSDAA